MSVRQVERDVVVLYSLILRSSGREKGVEVDKKRAAFMQFQPVCGGERKDVN